MSLHFVGALLRHNGGDKLINLTKLSVHNAGLRTTFFWALARPPDQGGGDPPAQVPNPPHKGAQEVHRWIFVRENL